MHRLLIATTNPAKFKEASAILANEGIELLGLKDFPGIAPAPETGTTFEENAILKAKSYYAKTGTPCIADDGGLMVDYLDSAPGVQSRRWAGENATDQERADMILAKLKGLPREKRTARLGGYIAFWNGETLLTSQNWVEGHIADRVTGKIQTGFPYRAILTVAKFNKPYAGLTEQEHAEVNFRRKNLNALKPEIFRLLRKQ